MTAPAPLNVVLLHADQLRADALGCMGNAFARTPALDRLAAAGAVCLRHIVANPVCMPSRASLLTGLYPSAHGVWCNGVALQRREYLPANIADHDPAYPVAAERATMADLLAGAGYDTAALGKLHLTPSLAPASYGYPESWSRWNDGRMDDWRGPYYGFRHVEVTHTHGDSVCQHGPYAAWLRERDPGLIERVMAHARSAPRPAPAIGDCFVSALPSGLHHSTWLGERACAYIERERPRDRPFFLWVGFPDPHHPFTPPADLAREFEHADVPEFRDPDGAAYPPDHPARGFLPTSVAELPIEQRRLVVRYTYALVHLLDRAVGRILDALERTGLADSTIVAFTSDHGDFLGDHGRLRKTVLGCDALARVPLVLRVPRAALPTRVSAPTSNVDLLPTLLDYAGLPLPGGLQGTPLRRILERPDDHRALVLCATGMPEYRNLTIWGPRHRLSWFPQRDYVELFDHAEDPHETANLARSARGRELAAALRRELADGVARAWEPSAGRISRW